jgi:Tfp pilus assembly protein PilF
LEVALKKIILGIVVAILIAGGVFFATADTKEEKAVKSLATARELVAKGDDARARVELRNALKNDEKLRDARILLAELLDKAGRRGDAFAQYRQLYGTCRDRL